MSTPMCIYAEHLGLYWHHGPGLSSVFSPYAQAILYVSSLFLAGVMLSLFGAYYQFTNQQNKYFRCYGWPFWFFAQVCWVPCVGKDTSIVHNKDKISW